MLWRTCTYTFKNMTALYWAASKGYEDDVKAILKSADDRASLLNEHEIFTGWTPLFIACIEGHLPIVRILLEAGSAYGLCDINGWTEKEHAVFRGHMNIAKCLISFAIGDSKYPPSGQILREMLRPEVQLKSTSEGHKQLVSPLKPLESRPSQNRTQIVQARILVDLGSCSTRSNLKAIDLLPGPADSGDLSEEQPRYNVTVRAVGASPTKSHIFQFPTQEETINTPLIFTTNDADNTSLVFKISRPKTRNSIGIDLLGTAIALLGSLRHTLAPRQESLIRDHTIPILENGSMRLLGTLTFNFLIIRPYQALITPSRLSPGFWKQDGSTQIVGHRGFGANSTTRTHLQIGENTILSFLSASNLGASCVEFDVQLTKDYTPVIFHDFLVMEMGADVPLQSLTADQFMHLSRSQAPNSSVVDAAETRYRDRTKAEIESGRRPRAHSVNTFDDYRMQDLMKRMQYTEEGIHNNIKGNLRGHSIQEPSSTLEQLLTQLPESLAFNLEIKYPMLWEAEDRGMDFFAIELNFFVDTILNMIFRLCGNRNITLSSFSPEVCIALALKQQHFPILFINKAGSVPAGDNRAASLQGAIEFAKAWNLAGIVMLSDTFVLCPRLLRYAKDSGLVVGSYGDLNDDPQCAVVSKCPSRFSP